MSCDIQLSNFFVKNPLPVRYVSLKKHLQFQLVRPVFFEDTFQYFLILPSAASYIFLSFSCS